MQVVEYQYQGLVLGQAFDEFNRGAEKMFAYLWRSGQIAHAFQRLAAELDAQHSGQVRGDFAGALWCNRGYTLV